ncbi:hypothetical protein INT45_007930 [Circinella minor]|uniref:Uncharacterized protein n=1 Tax=Circinella minor TaxID=1195481 RepID=A0A8H7S9R1_9FUNG|nr:hypothetical protein INT45_007930 [Circinella minor]
MADHSSTRPHSNHHATPTPSSSNHSHTNNDNRKYHNNNHHASSTTTPIKANSSETSTKQNRSAANQSHSPPGISSNIILLPSNVPVMTDPYFGKPSPVNISTPSKTKVFHSATINVTASTTPTVGSSNQQQKQIAGPLVGAILGTIGLISIIIGVVVCIKRRKKIKRRQDDHIYSDNSRAGALFINQQQQLRQQQQYATIKREKSNHSDSSTLQPPPTSYTPHCQKRLTADTLVDQRASLSTVSSSYSSRNNQYIPQLAYKQQLHEDYDVKKGQDDYYDLDGVSPSNTLIDTTAITMALTADDKAMENTNSRRQRVPSYQPKIVAMTDDENINNNEQHVPAGQQEQHATNNNNIYASDVKGTITSNYYDYLYQTNYSHEQQYVNQQRKQNHGH